MGESDRSKESDLAGTDNLSVELTKQYQALACQGTDLLLQASIMASENRPDEHEGKVFKEGNGVEFTDSDGKILQIVLARHVFAYEFVDKSVASRDTVGDTKFVLGNTSSMGLFTYSAELAEPKKSKWVCLWKFHEGQIGDIKTALVLVKEYQRKLKSAAIGTKRWF